MLTILAVVAVIGVRSSRGAVPVTAISARVPAQSAPSFVYRIPSEGMLPTSAE